MGKKNQPRDEAPKPTSVSNRETFQRLNFLYQASVYLRSVEGSESSLDTEARQSARKRRRITSGDLGSSYVRTMKAIGNKSVTRIDPNVKRTLCGGCDTILMPGVTATVRVKGIAGRRNKVVYTCIDCEASRGIPAPPVTSSSTPAPIPISASQPSESNPDATEVSEIGGRRKRRPKQARHLPLFARPDAGHVIFRGNEALRDAES